MIGSRVETIELEVFCDPSIPQNFCTNFDDPSWNYAKGGGGLQGSDKEWDICTPPPEGSWPFSAPRALPGRPRDVERSSRPEGGLEVPEGLKMARSPRAEVYKSHSYTFEHTF